MVLARRTFLKRSGGVAAYVVAATSGALWMEEVFADPGWNQPAFAAKSIDDAVKALGGDKTSESLEILLSVPDIAENGAVVPVIVESKLPGTKMIAVLVDKNPNALSASFDVLDGTEPWVSTRVKMAESSNVIALVKTESGFFVASKPVKVTLGGCGG